MPNFLHPDCGPACGRLRSPGFQLHQQADVVGGPLPAPCQVSRLVEGRFCTQDPAAAVRQELVIDALLQRLARRGIQVIDAAGQAGLVRVERPVGVDPGA